MDKCENCGRDIGKLEVPDVWRGRTVCAECRRRLSPDADEGFERVAREMDAEDRTRPLTDDDLVREQRAAMRGSYRPAPRPLEKFLGLATRGQAWAVVILGLFLTPGIIGIPLVIWGGMALHQMSNRR